ncbi:MAG TPA: GspH/FimT family pseudopilin [Acidiferrobacterales bacterium]|jgi:type IV fimbrial biogenesis protein FimT
MRQGSLRRRPGGRRLTQYSGFSLYELLVTLAVAGIVLGAGMPALRASVQSARLTAAVNGFITALHYTRSEAIKRALPVSLCPSVDRRTCDPRDAPLLAWQGGWLIYVNPDGKGDREAGDELLRVFDGHGGDLAIQASSSRPRVTYRANGFAPATNLTLSFCDARGPAAARSVIVSNAGRPRVARRKPDGSAPDCPARG